MNYAFISRHACKACLPFSFRRICNLSRVLVAHCQSATCISTQFVKILVVSQHCTALHTYLYNARASAHSGRRNMNTKPAKVPHTRAQGHPTPQTKHTALLTMRCPRRRRLPGSRPQRLQTRASPEVLWREHHCQRTGAASHSGAKLSALPQTLPCDNWMYQTCVESPMTPQSLLSHAL